jgi:ecotin
MRILTLPERLIAMVLLTYSMQTGADAQAELNAFPAAETGMQRWVIWLAPQTDEADWQVEIAVGRAQPTDGVNQVWLSNRLETRQLQGWGYDYFWLSGPPQTASTLMAATPGSKPITRWVHTQPVQTRYNSRLPIVVYSPTDTDVHYRFWRADQHWQNAARQ